MVAALVGIAFQCLLFEWLGDVHESIKRRRAFGSGTALLPPCLAFTVAYITMWLSDVPGYASGWILGIILGVCVTGVVAGRVIRNWESQSVELHGSNECSPPGP